MKVRSTVAVLSVLALSVVLAGPLAAQGDPAAVSPGEPHKHLARLAGDWTYASKMWMDPSQPPLEWGGTIHGEVLLGGRYVEHTWKGNVMGMPYEGRRTDAYDNVAKQYISTWIDNRSTGITYSTGTCDEARKVCTQTGGQWDPMTGQQATMKWVTTWLDDNSFKLEMFGKGPDGKEMKMMETTAKRK